MDKKSKSIRSTYKDYYNSINPSLNLPRRTASYRKQKRQNLDPTTDYLNDPNVMILYFEYNY